MQGIYNYIPETNCVSRVYSVAVVLYLQFVLLVLLFRPWNMFCTFTLAFSVVCVQCTIWLFFFLQFLNFVLSWCVVQVLSEFFLIDMVPIPPIITGVPFAVTFHIRWINILRSLYFEIISASFVITFLSPGIATSINMHVSCLWSRIMMCGLLLGMILSVRTCRFP